MGIWTPVEASEAEVVEAGRSMCVGGELSTQPHRAFKRRLSCRPRDVLQHEATGVRGGMILQKAAVQVLLNDAMPIMVRPKNSAGLGCAERARRSR
jgi:hypothetical protein